MQRGLVFAALIFGLASLVSASLPNNNAAKMMDYALQISVNEGKNPLLACYASGGRPGYFTPTTVARGYRAVAVGMYDAWSRFDNLAEPVYATAVARQGDRSAENKALAVVYAAYFVINYLLPEQTAAFNLVNTVKTNLGVDLTVQTSLPAQIANQTATALIAALAKDGFNQANCYADNTNFVPINQPTVFSNLTTVTAAKTANSRAPLNWSQLIKYGLINTARSFLTPHAGFATPFAINAGSILPPPLPSTTTMASQFQAVADYQAQLDANSGRLRVIAEYWADGPKSSLPPGHWMEITLDVAAEKSYDLDHTVRVLFSVGNAVYDGGIAAWMAKRVYQSARPATYITTFLYATPNETMTNMFRGSYCDLGTIAAWEWTPYQAATFRTPPFPEYVSGHSTFSRAAAEALSAYTGSLNFPTPYSYVVKAGKSLFEPFCGANGKDIDGATCTPGYCSFDSAKNSSTAYWPKVDVTVGPFTSYLDAANDAGISRLYGGIHIEAGDIEGRTLGANVATATNSRSCSYMKVCVDSKSSSPASSLDSLLSFVF